MLALRPATVDDVGAILGIQVAADQPVRNGAALEAAIIDVQRLVLVAEREGQFIGWAKTHYWAYDDGSAPAGHYLGGITVSPDGRRGGVGSALTGARLRWIWTHASEAWYVTNSQNTASMTLHRRWGFEEVARGPRFHTTSFDGGVGTLWRADHFRAVPLQPVDPLGVSTAIRTPPGRSPTT